MGGHDRHLRDTGQFAALLFVGCVVLIIGAVLEWLADNWRHRH